jgi:branched-chain amino acid transport system ATP-binding protein
VVTSARASDADRHGQLGLRASGLSVSFAGLHAVADVDLVLEPGEILGLIGPNGAGKTTITNALTGFQTYVGSLRLNGTDVTGWLPRRLATAGVRRSFQAVRLFRGMSVYENVEAMALGLGMRSREAASASREALSWFGLEDVADARSDSLPYGMERRLGICRAMVGEPRYVLLDEPAAGLNEEESDDLLARLAAVPQQFGCGLMVIEHDMRLIMRLCHRLQVLDHGRTLAIGSPVEVRRNPKVVEAYLGTAAGHGDA